MTQRHLGMVVAVGLRSKLDASAHRADLMFNPSEETTDRV